MVNQAHSLSLDAKLNGLGIGPFKKKRRSVFGSSLTGKATQHQVSVLLKAEQSKFLLPSRGTPGQNYLCAETSKLPLAELILWVEAQLNKIISSSQNWPRSRVKLLKISVTVLELAGWYQKYFWHNTVPRKPHRGLVWGFLLLLLLIPIPVLMLQHQLFSLLYIFTNISSFLPC